MKDFTMGTLEEILADPAATFEELKPMLRPEGIHNGIMRVDPDKCNSCGLCMKNCPFRCWEVGENNVPRMKEEYICFSCFNCLVACPVNAVSVVQTFAVKDAFFDTDFPGFKMPVEPKDAEGKPDQWTGVEQVIMNRRSVRNFKNDPVPDSLIRRILEAGRFAPRTPLQSPASLHHL
ncbi:MAG: nitroreductase family protein [Thermodesulfobacteriota bacterium]